MARTWKVCEPWLEAGVALRASCRSVQPPPSSWHSNVEPPSLELNEKSALAELLGSFGCAVIVVFGAAVSIVHVKLAGVASVLPAASVARTSKVCEPWPRPV